MLQRRLRKLFSLQPRPLQTLIHTLYSVWVSESLHDKQEWTLLSSELLEVWTSHRYDWRDDVVTLRIRLTDFSQHFWESWTNSDLSRFRKQSIVNVPQLLRTRWAIVSRCSNLQRKADLVSIKTLKWQQSDTETRSSDVRHTVSIKVRQQKWRNLDFSSEPTSVKLKL